MARLSRSRLGGCRNLSGRRRRRCWGRRRSGWSRRSNFQCRRMQLKLGTISCRLSRLADGRLSLRGCSLRRNGALSLSGGAGLGRRRARRGHLRGCHFRGTFSNRLSRCSGGPNRGLTLRSGRRGAALSSTRGASWSYGWGGTARTLALSGGRFSTGSVHLRLSGGRCRALTLWSGLRRSRGHGRGGSLGRPRRARRRYLAGAAGNCALARRGGSQLRRLAGRCRRLKVQRPVIRLIEL